MKKTSILLVIIVILILLPKPFDVVGGIVGNSPGPWKCFGYGFSPTSDNYPDAQNTIYCVGIPYK